MEEKNLEEKNLLLNFSQFYFKNVARAGMTSITKIVFRQIKKIYKKIIKIKFLFFEVFFVQDVFRAVTDVF